MSVVSYVAQGIKKSFSGVEVLHGVDLRYNREGYTGFLGTTAQGNPLCSR